MKKITSPTTLFIKLNEKTKQQVLELLGHSNYHSDFDVWSYELIKNWFHRRKMIIFFNEDVVLDVQITDYVLGNIVRKYFS